MADQDKRADGGAGNQNNQPPQSSAHQNIQVNNNPNNPNNSNNAPQQNQAQGDGISELIKQAAHPMICIVMLSFKVSAIVAFILLDLFVRDAIAYLAVIILGSAEFWMTKNVAGRMLVGLRWWNEVKEDGAEVWIFESKNEKKETGADSKIFWSSLYIYAFSWLALFIWDLIRLKFVWGLIALILLVFAGTNLYGYVKCSKEQQSNILKFGAKTVLKAAEKGADVAKNQV